MKQKRKQISILIATVITAVVIIGIFVPLGTYTTRYGCPTDPMPTQRLRLILGQTLANVKRNDKPQTNPLVGCSQDKIFVQYLF
jgi:hypothetical protein